MNTQFRKGIFAALCLFILILDSKTAVAGGLSGIDLCLKTVIPSLFPFFVLTNILTKSLYGISSKSMGLLANIFGLPKEGSILLLSALLGGYPVGAKCIADYYQTGALSKEDAERLLAYCSNTGPAFIFGLISGLFQQRWIPWAIWIIQILSTLFVAGLFSRDTEIKLRVLKQNTSISEAVYGSLQAMSQVCAWVILFRILISFLRRWILWFLPKPMQVIFVGLLELANGCIELSGLNKISSRFIICSVLLSFGGICVMMQTCAVAKNLSTKKYIQGKLLQALFSLILSALFIYHRWCELFILAGIYLFVAGKFRKKVEFRNKMVYSSYIDSGRL